MIEVPEKHLISISFVPDFAVRGEKKGENSPLCTASFLHRSSVASAFASNVVMVLFECSDGYSVATYVQEHPTQLPGCGNQLCPLDVVVALYKDIVDGCDVDELCSLNGGWLRSAWNTLLWGLPALSMLV